MGGKTWSQAEIVVRVTRQVVAASLVSVLVGFLLGRISSPHSDLPIYAKSANTLPHASSDVAPKNAQAEVPPAKETLIPAANGSGAMEKGGALQVTPELLTLQGATLIKNDDFDLSQRVQEIFGLSDSQFQGVGNSFKSMLTEMRKDDLQVMEQISNSDGVAVLIPGDPTKSEARASDLKAKWSAVMGHNNAQVLYHKIIAELNVKTGNLGALDRVFAFRPSSSGSNSYLGYLASGEDLTADDVQGIQRGVPQHSGINFSSYNFTEIPAFVAHLIEKPK
ncbi:MAG: hypothetical protein ACR2OZ_11245 [Verrucomicrobiales bacterium]